MKTARVFIAISLPAEIQNSLSTLSTKLKMEMQDGVVRWINPANIHLTLKFLGEIPESEIPLLKTRLDIPIGQLDHISLSIEKVGVFPNLQHPRIVWAGLKSSDGLSHTQTCVEEVIADMGYNREDRPFAAHLTLGRVNQYANAQQLIQCGRTISSYPVGGMGSFIVKSIDIYRSELKPGGSIYTKLYSIPMKRESVLS